MCSCNAHVIKGATCTCNCPVHEAIRKHQQALADFDKQKEIGYQIAFVANDGPLRLVVVKCPHCKALTLEDDATEHMASHKFNRIG